jgi:hypothetical protein
VGVHSERDMHQNREGHACQQTSCARRPVARRPASTSQAQPPWAGSSAYQQPGWAAHCFATYIVVVTYKAPVSSGGHNGSEVKFRCQSMFRYMP